MKKKLVLLMITVFAFSLSGLGVNATIKGQRTYTIFIPMTTAPSLIDLYCDDPIGTSIGPWPICPKIAFGIQSNGIAHLGPNIHNWSKYRLIRIDQSHGNPWDQDMDQNPIYDPTTWDLVATLNPVQQSYDLSCQSGYYMVLGDMDLPDPRGVMPNFQFCLTQ